ncbi:MAG: nucleotidyltransferase family protein [Gemmatimonadetes bacterium]|nr:nucleotidyltransferase family protein [Gemmatimonadota bacterium]NNM04088.1 nucleotidyltransferase family protein [Gemmatimonadota bacterium]
MIETFPAIIPAAGRSSRMGTPKALLDAGGLTFLARVMASLREGGSGPLLVVVRKLDSPLATEARFGGAQVVLNPDPSQGPISSLQAGIRALPEGAGAVFLAPVDHPLFSSATVRALAHGFGQERPPLAVPALGGRRGHPVLLGSCLFPELLEKNLPQGARTVLRRYLGDRLEVPVQDPGILADIDTPEEYERYFPSGPSE